MCDVWLLMCDEKLDKTLPDTVRCSSREVREEKIYEIHRKYTDNTSNSQDANHIRPITKR